MSGRGRARPAGRRTQRGVALIILMIIVVLGMAWMLMSAIGSWLNPTATERIANGKVLGEAKAALIGYVAKEAIDSSETSPGRLPCPEAPGYVGTSNEGIAAGSCSLPAIGRLPWRTLGLDELVDASGSPLWYVVSPGWALPSTTSTVDVNFSSQGQLTVDGQTNAAVALIIAPGAPLHVATSANCTARDQSRNTTPPDYRDYLECQNASGGTSFVTSGPVNSFNDQLVKITASDILRAISAPIAQRIQRDIAPQILSAAQTMPGASTSTPTFPFAQSWGDPSTIANPFGTASTFNGLLPLARSRKSCDPATDASCNTYLKSKPCVPGSDAQCDLSTAVSWAIGNWVSNTSINGSYTSATVTWNDGSQVVINIAPDYGGSGRIGYVSCGSSTSSSILCTIYYGSPSCSWYGCSSSYPKITITASGKQVGMAFRQLNPAYLASVNTSSTFLTSSANNTVSLASTGNATVTTEWQLPWSSGCSWWNWNCTSTTIQIPSLYVTDNVAFQSALRDAPSSGPDLRWFLRDGWQQWLYYAASQGYAPGGPGACGGSNPSCLTVDNNPAPNNDKRALLVFSGPALTGRTQPSSQLADYFEGENATPADTIFENRPVLSRAFNDRVLVIAP